MAATKIAARDYLFQIAVGATPTWTGIGGLTTFTVNPGDKVQETEATDFDSGGQFEQLVMQRGGSIKLEGRKKIDKATGAPDAGQDAVDQLGQQVADASVGQIRWRHKNETRWRVWNCTIKSTEQGGGTNDLGKWGAEITRTGAETTVAAP